MCKDNNLFKQFEPIEDGSIIYVGKAQVKRKGTIELEFISKKTLTFNGVYYVPEVRKNLVSGNLFDKFGFNLVLFKINKFILAMDGIFMRKCNMYVDMFELNINKNKVSCAYIIDFFYLIMTII